MALAWVQALRAAERDASLTAEQKQILAGEYAHRAIAHLVRLRQSGYFQAADKRQLLENTDDFTPIQTRPEFRAFIERLSQAGN